ncbi:BolA family protein [Phenylobacterium immobile]|uniref:BolA family protein n=1 Tax=Phenylobacterium immobile TaxID=21 RepID=UPI000B2A59A3|nr:BolA family protein [Phenylobacterium immobile]
MGAISETIQRKLVDAFSPDRLEVVDDSARHHGHAGAREGGESHFNLLIQAKAFVGLSKVARQRLVYRTLAEELAGQVHALSVRALAPGEEA